MLLSHSVIDIIMVLWVQGVLLAAPDRVCVPQPQPHPPDLVTAVGSPSTPPRQRSMPRKLKGGSLCCGRFAPTGGKAAGAS